MRWKRGAVTVEQLGTGTWVDLGGTAVALDAPAGFQLGERRLDGVLMSSGRLERVAGLLGLLVGRTALELWVPLADDRAALVAELAQQAWQRTVVVDALTPGSRVDLGDGELEVHALPAVEEHAVLGFTLEHRGVRVAYLPRTQAGGAARRLVRGADLVIPQPGAWPLAQLVELAGPADVLVPTRGLA